MHSLLLESFIPTQCHKNIPIFREEIGSGMSLSEIKGGSFAKPDLPHLNLMHATLPQSAKDTGSELRWICEQVVSM